MLQARIQHASLPKHFQHSRTTMEEMKKLEIWKNSNWKKMEKLNVIFYSIILLMCAYSLSVAKAGMWYVPYQQQQKSYINHCL